MNISQVPPGFRFHPTDEELVDYYLRKKVASRRIDLDVIKEIDLYKIEPWDLQEKCSIGTDQEQNEWYFFSHKDKKYPTGTRTNRATTAGFWKATGRDKAIYSKHNLIGMRKTLVFYKGRAPNGQKSDWIMHEYRLETSESGTPQEEGWVVCRAFKKRMAVVHKVNEHGSPCWYSDQVSFMPDMDSTRRISTLQPHNIDAVYSHYPSSNSCKQEFETQIYQMPHELLLHLPHLESPKLPTSSSTICNPISVFNASYGHDDNAGDRSFLAGTSLAQDEHVQQEHQTQMNSIYEVNNDNFYGSNREQVADDQVTDWRVLHKYVASQLSPGDAPRETFSFIE